MNIALVEDLENEQMRIGSIIKEYSSANHINIELSIFNNAESFLESYRPLKYTLIFMDIYMDEMTDIDAARKIRTVDNDTLIVFLTTSEDHAFSAFDVHAYHYIIKPESDETLKESLYKVLNDIAAMQSANVERLMISSDGTDKGIPYHNIKYISSNRNYVQIICKDNSEYHPRMTFSEICEILNKDNRFLRINRGILCFAPMKNRLRYNIKYIIIAVICLFAFSFPILSYFETKYTLGYNALIFPLLILCFIAYCMVLFLKMPLSHVRMFR